MLHLTALNCSHAGRIGTSTRPHNLSPLDNSIHTDWDVDRDHNYNQSKHTLLGRIGTSTRTSTGKTPLSRIGTWTKPPANNTKAAKRPLDKRWSNIHSRAKTLSNSTLPGRIETSTRAKRTTAGRIHVIFVQRRKTMMPFGGGPVLLILRIFGANNVRPPSWFSYSLRILQRREEKGEKAGRRRRNGRREEHECEREPMIPNPSIRMMEV